MAKWAENEGGKVEVEASTPGQEKCEVLIQQWGSSHLMTTTGIAVTKQCNHTMFCQ